MSGAGLAGVVFDLDGVLTDTEGLWEEAWRAAAARRGGRWAGTDTAAVQGMSPPEWSRYLARSLGEPAEAAALRAECVAFVVDAVGRGRGPLLGGARELLETVSGRLPVALASSAPRALIEAVLAAHDLGRHFGATVSSEEVARGKPSPDVYLAAAAGIGLDPKRGLAFEDSTNGILAASAAGLAVVALPRPAYPPRAEALALAERVLADCWAARAHVLSLLGAGMR